MSYSIKEIIDIAIGTEEAGYEFYTKCSEKFDKDNIKETFVFLAKEELGHIKGFNSMKKNEENESGIFNDDYFQYLKAIGGGSIFSVKKIDDVMKSIKTPEDAINKAFNDEKAAILFYSEIKTLYKEDSEKAILLEKIINEERKHVRKLIELMEVLSK